MEDINNLHLKNGKYTLHGRLIFDTIDFNKKLILTPQDALEIAYTLFDWANQPYDAIEKIEELIENGEI